MSTTVAVIVVVALIVIGLAVWYVNRQRSLQLRTHFGPEYDRLARSSSPRAAEATLVERTHRVHKLPIRPLRPDERENYATRWRACQARFVDDPGGAVLEADTLVAEVMRARGYPVGDFERQAADVSVDHPRVVANYRTAHEIAIRQQGGRAGTEDLRNAVIHYRALFDDLLDAKEDTR